MHAMRIGFIRWQNNHLPRSVVIILVALVIGVLTGIAAAALKWLVKLINEAALSSIRIDRPDYRLLIWPLAGILLTGIYQRYIVRGNIARGTRIIKQDLDSGKYRLRHSTVYSPLLGCGITMGLGATGGTEGPTALSGAAMGSWIGRWLGLSDSWLRILVAIGAGAGIAAIFKSPMGGVLFTLEVLQVELTTLPIIAMIMACLIASSTALALSDFTFDIFFVRDMPMDPHTLGWVALLGVFCGLYSIWYSGSKLFGIKIFSSIRNPWVGSIATGLALSFGVFLFPVLFGEGFEVITHLVNGEPVTFIGGGLFSGYHGTWWLFGSIIAIILVKGFLVSASYSNGGVAGDFVPTLFAGALVGYLFTLIINNVTTAELPVWYFSLIGMGAVMAGTLHAPLMAIFILCETTNTYAYIFPYLIAIAISYATVKIIMPKSWDAETGHDDLIALLQNKYTPKFNVGFDEERKH